MNDTAPPPPNGPQPPPQGQEPLPPQSFDYGALGPSDVGPSPWAQPTPPAAGPPPGGYASMPPAPMPGQVPEHIPGMAPQAPYPGQQLPTVSINDFRESSGRRWLIIGACLAVAVALAVGIFVFTQAKPGVPAASASPSAIPTSPPTPKGPQDELAWESSSGKGTWKVTSTEWVGDSVTIGLDMTCSEGSLRYRLMGYTNDTSRALTPVNSRRQPDVKSGVLRQGDHVTGYVTFEMSPGDGTVYLTDLRDNAVSARAFKK